jgi:hypothetical protein
MTSDDLEGISIADCEIESRLSDKGEPILRFRSAGNPVIDRNIPSVMPLRQLLADAGNAELVERVNRHIEQARKLRREADEAAKQRQR